MFASIEAGKTLARLTKINDDGTILAQLNLLYIKNHMPMSKKLLVTSIVQCWKKDLKWNKLSRRCVYDNACLLINDSTYPVVEMRRIHNRFSIAGFPFYILLDRPTTHSGNLHCFVFVTLLIKTTSLIRNLHQLPLSIKGMLSIYCDCKETIQQVP